MNTVFLVMLLKPFITFVFFVLMLLPARLAVRRFVKEGRLKRFLLFRIHDDF